MKEQDLAVVVSTLGEEFSIFREVEGESVPVQDVHNGLHKNGKEGTDLVLRTNVLCFCDDLPLSLKKYQLVTKVPEMACHIDSLKITCMLRVGQVYLCLLSS